MCLRKSRKNTWSYLREAIVGRVFIEGNDTQYDAQGVTNVHLSKCFVCEKVAVWVHKSLIYPPQKSGPEANADTPPDVLRDYEEAQSILELSPRGAAALLRLGIQKLCKDLGEPGKHLDTDIASLVKKGLNPIVQKSLDIVRVIGNELSSSAPKKLPRARLRPEGLVGDEAFELGTAPAAVCLFYAIAEQAVILSA